MSTKKHPPSAAAAIPTPMDALGAAGDLPRQQLAMATLVACAMFRGFEAIRKTQEQAAHRALSRHAAAAEKLKAPCAASELLAVESDLLRFDLEGASEYWSQLGATAMTMQGEILGCLSHGFDSQQARNAGVAALQAMPAMVAAFGNGAQYGNSRSEAS